MMANIKKHTQLLVILFTTFFFTTTTFAQFVINGSAQDLGNGEYLLTPAQRNKVGTIWSDQKVSLNNSFEIELELYFGTSDRGADGITFSLQPKSNTVGVAGQGLGIGGITPSLITEMDTYRNGNYGDPSFDHIALTKNTVDHKGGDNLVSPVRTVNGKDNVEDGTWYNFKATWNPTTQIYEVFVNGASRILYKGDIINTVFNGDPNVYWGFTGSTGGAHNLQKVRIINTTILDLFTCTETPNDQTFCPTPGGSTVGLSISNTQTGATYEWYDTKAKDNLLGTGTTFTTPAISDNTDYYVLAKTTGGITTATVGPTGPTTIDGINDFPYLAGYDRNFTAHAPIKIKSVQIEHPAWQSGCGAAGSTKLANIDVYNSSGVIVATKLVNAVCGQLATMPLDFDLPAGSYTMKLRGIVAGTFRLSSDASEKSIPGVITLENNVITNQWGTSIPYSGVFFNWELEGGVGTSECLFSVKAEKNCPPCATFPTVTIGNDFIYCSDNDTTITATTSAANVLWNTNETTNDINVNEGTFTVSAWDDENCKTYESITINKECPPNLVLVDSIEVCTGITSRVTAEGIQTGFWSSDEPFTQISDSVIEINLQNDAIFHIKNYTKLNILSDNSNFEQPVTCNNCYRIVDGNTVPGWETTAADGKIEIWSSGFSGVQAYSGNQFIEINANQDAALYQDVSTTPGEVMAVSLAHRGRVGTDVLEVLAGPPGGPYQSINTYSDAQTWEHYTDYYTIPPGQTTTRYLFETVSCNGGPCTGTGNFLDAIQFFKLREENDSVVVITNQTPIINLGNDSTFCNSVSLTLDAGNPGYQHTWSTTETTQTIEVTNADTYSVTVENKGCTAQDEIIISEIFCACTQPKMPTINGVSGDTILSLSLDFTQAVNESISSFSAGERYKVSVSGTWSAWSSNPANHVVDGAFRYKEKNASADITPIESGWQLNGASTQRPIPNIYNVEHVYWYYLESNGNDLITFSDPNYADNSGGLNLEFFKLPDTVRACQANTSTSLSDYVQGENIMWYTSAIGGIGSSTVPSVDNNIIQITEFWVTQTVNGCESERTPVLYKVVTLPSYNINSLTTEICAGDSAEVNIELNGLAPYNIYYTSSISGNQSVLSVNQDSMAVKAFQTETIRIDSISDANCSFIDTASVSIKTKNLPIITGIDSSRCGPGEVLLKARTDEGDIHWFTDSIGGVTQEINTEFNTPTILNSTIFYAQSFSNGCNSERIPIEATIHLIPLVDLGNDTTFCEGESLILNAKNSGFEHEWNTSEITQTILASTTKTYAVKVTSDENCITKDSIKITIQAKPVISLGNDTSICEGQSLLLDATNPNSTYLWNSSEISPTLLASSTGKYLVTVTDDLGCIGKDSIAITSSSLPSVNLGKDTTICEGKSVVLNSGYTYPTHSIIWRTPEGTVADASSWSATKTGNYVVKVSTSSTCYDEDTIVINIQENPVINLGNDTSICDGQSLLLDATYTNSTYLWNNSETTPTLSISNAGEYSVIVTDNIGCKGSDKLTLTVNNMPNVNLGNDTTMCNGNSLILNAGNNGFNYLWNNKSTSKTTHISKSGTYFIKVFSTVECFDLDTIKVNYVNNPIVDLGENIEISEGDLHLFDAKNGDAFYLWNTYETSQSIQTSTEGLYSVTVTDSFACQGYDEVFLTILENVVIPNSFTPNGDGVNDVWTIQGLSDYPNASIKIFNRWGNTVNEQTGNYKEWDGKNNGTEVPEGVYFYIIMLNDSQNRIIKSNVTILR